MGARGVGRGEKGASPAPSGVRTQAGEGVVPARAGEGWREEGMPRGRRNACNLEALGAQRAASGMRGGGSSFRAGLVNCGFSRR